ncbi:UNVERIFIED_CONTAM: hypothetical protein HDU68_000573 [Siphonaria sp. JEL0065]|nr:hypothetical protein HDU68_000573 [Siphonaria sp. JEL0065]
MIFSLLLASALAAPLQHPMTPYESAIDASRIAKRILSDSIVVGELATIMADTKHSHARTPLSTLEMIWTNDCEDPHNNKDPWLALVSWGVHATNIKKDPNASIHVRDKYFYTRPNHNDEKGLLNHPRFTLFGTLVQMESTQENIECMLKKHPDVKEWFSSHSFKLFKLETKGDVYFLGGYGDQHYVGWVPENVYQSSQ